MDTSEITQKTEKTTANPAQNEKSKISSFFEFLALFLAVKIIIYTPLMMALPQEVSDTIFLPSEFIYNKLFTPSDFSLTSGKSCNQAATTCIDSFNFQGPIRPGDAPLFSLKLHALIEKSPNVHTICFESLGGDNSSAAKIAKEIKDLGMNTCVADMQFNIGDLLPSSGARYTSTCASACTFILLSGRERIAVGDRFKLGIHSAKDTYATGNSLLSDNTITNDQISYTDPDTLKKVYKQYSGSLSISDDQLKKILAATTKTPPTKMYTTSTNEQMSFGFFTKRLN